jgi:hypothetical protein
LKNFLLDIVVFRDAWVDEKPVEGILVAHDVRLWVNVPKINPLRGGIVRVNL